MNEWQRMLQDARTALAKGLSEEDVNAWITHYSRGKATDLASLTGLAKAAPSPLSLLRPLAQGATFNFADELAGLGAALVPGGDDYTTARDRFRAKEAETRAAYPNLSKLSGLVGGLALLPLGGPLAGEGGALAQVLRGTAIGAGAGGTAAVGASERPGLQSLEDAPPGLLMGGAMGGGLATAAEVAPGAAAYLRRLRNPAAAGQQAARQTVGETIQALGGPQRVTEMATATARPHPDQTMLADADQALARYLDLAATENPQVDARVNSQLAARAARSSDRVTQAIEATGGPRLNRTTATDRLDALREQTGREVYGPLTDKFTPSQDLLDYLGQPMIARELQSAQALDDLRGVQPGVPGFFERLQRVRSRIDDAQSAAERSGQANQARIYGQIHQKMTDLMEQSFPGYKAANRQYAGAMARLDGLEQGREALTGTTTPEEISDAMAQLRRKGGPGAADNYRMAAFDELIRRINQPGNTTLRALTAKPGGEWERKLAALFPSRERLQSFLESLQWENGALTSVAKGSQTATREALSRAAGGAEPPSGSFPSIVAGYLRQLLGTRTPAVVAARSTELERLLATPGLSNILQSIQDASGTAAATARRASLQRTAAAGLPLLPLPSLLQPTPQP